MKRSSYPSNRPICTIPFPWWNKQIYGPFSQGFKIVQILNFLRILFNFFQKWILLYCFEFISVLTLSVWFYNKEKSIWSVNSMFVRHLTFILLFLLSIIENNLILFFCHLFHHQIELFFIVVQFCVLVFFFLFFRFVKSNNNNNNI